MDKTSSEIIEWEDQTAQRLGSKKKKSTALSYFICYRQIHLSATQLIRYK